MDNTNIVVSDADPTLNECRALVDILARVGDKWTVMVVGTLSAGPMRYNAIQRRIGAISQRMLTLTLKGLEEDGLVTRTVFPVIPPRVDYELTDLGRTLLEPITILFNWASVHQSEMLMARAKFREGSARGF